MLGRHPEVQTPRPGKEPQFFALEPEIVRERFDWYSKLFERAGPSHRLDASSLYLPSPDAPGLIDEMLGSVTVLILVRHPVERTHSSYMHLHKRRARPERRSFAEIVGSMEDLISGTAGSVFEVESELIRRAIEAGRIDGEYLGSRYLTRSFGAPFESEFQDRYIPYRYFGNSLYRSLIGRWEAVFRGRVKVIPFEVLVERPQSCLKHISEFLSLRPDRGPAAFPQVNPTAVVRTELHRRIIEWRHESPAISRLVQFIDDIGLADVRRRITRPLFYTSRERLSEDLTRRVESLLLSEVEWWAATVERFERELDVERH